MTIHSAVGPTKRWPRRPVRGSVRESDYVRHSSAVRVVLLGAALVAVCLPSPASAQILRPDLLPREDRAAVRVSLGLENDNLLFGFYRIFGGDDGDDTGRTHGLDLQIGAVLPEGIEIGLQVETALFLTDNGRPRRYQDADGNFLYRDDEGNEGYLVDDVFVDAGGGIVPRENVRKVAPRQYVDPNGEAVRYRRRTFVRDGEEARLDLNSARRVPQREDLPIDFREITFLRVHASNRPAPDALYLRGTVGAVIVNGRRVTWGATGQQQVWHRVVDWRQYDYRAAAEPNQYGFVVSGEVGFDANLLELGSARFLARAGGGLELMTLVDGNRAFAIGSVSVEGGAADSPWGELRLTQEAHAYVPAGEVNMVSRVYGALHGGPISFFLRLNLYWGGLVNDWFAYNRNRPTTDGGLELRF